MTVDHPLPAHSLLGASAAHRWLNCPGSFALSQKAPPSRSSIYAATGTLAHDFIEKIIGNNVKTPHKMKMDPGVWVGTGYSVEGHEITIDEDFIEGVNLMLSYVATVSSAYDMMHCEMTVHLDMFFKTPPPVAMFGRTDVVLLSPHMLEIVDYKNGSGVIVDPHRNPQMLYYAAGVVAAVSRMKPRPDIHSIKLTVVQPHARSIAKVRSTTLDYIDLMLWVDEVLIPGVDACAAPDAPLVPGSWCRFCPVSFACPALIHEANRMAKIEFDDEKLSDDPNELSRQLDVAALASVWIEAIRAHALEKLQRQERIPNWGLVPTRPVRRWKDETVVEHVVSELGLSPGDTHRSELKSPAQLEKVVQKRVSRSAWDTRIAPLIESHSSGVKLNRENVEEVFEDAHGR
jgi:hypothetical protein